jgi:hypothetical protein
MNKPDKERPVNKATMDQPQEEFIDDNNGGPQDPKPPAIRKSKESRSIPSAQNGSPLETNE